jgi:hypothetical protein
MNTSLARMTGAVAMAMAVGSTALLGPVGTASAAPTVSGTATTSVGTAAPTGERNTRVSRSMTGIRASAYIGKYYSSRHEGTRKCIVRKESHGNYRIVSSGGSYRGAYQFNAHLARATAKRMGRSDLVYKPFNHWSRFDQDKAFWTVWNHGKGRGNWPTARGC